MRLLLLISLSLPLLFWQNACAQTAPADDFFNSGAQLYISNNIPSALEKVEGGLKIYPDDVKLKKLEALLKQQQQSQSSQSQQNQQQQSQQNSAQNQAQQGRQQQNQQAQNQSQSGQQNDKQQQEKAQAKSSGKESDEKQDGQNEQAKAAAVNQMTPEEAQRLLDAQKGDEQVLQLKPKGKPQDNHQPIKDW
jgi:Mg-chelatase subunit ChlI